MSYSTPSQPAGWYHAQGDPPDTKRYWDGQAWQGEPQVMGAAPIPPPPGYAPTPNLADAGPRIGARIIDWIIVGIVNVVITLILIGDAISSAFTTGVVDTPYWRTLLVGILGTLVLALYETLMVGYRGATLGKMALSLKIVNEDSSAVSLETAALRIAPYAGLSLLGGIITSTLLGGLIQLVTFVFVLAGLVMLFTNARKQTPWDIIAKTLVVRR